MKIKVNYFSLLILLMSLLAACGTNKKDQEQVTNTSAKGDITRPPVFVKGGELNTETNPEETISAEEWQKQQDEKE